MKTQRLILVTGASGYVGGRLVRDLVSDKCAVRVLVRDAQKVSEQPWAKDVEIVAGNANNLADMRRAVLAQSVEDFRPSDLVTVSQFAERGRRLVHVRIYYHWNKLSGRGFRFFC